MTDSKEISEKFISSPISQWKRAIEGEREVEGLLEEIVLENPVKNAELLIESYCQYQCLHCIYPETFARDNKSLQLKSWNEIIIRLVKDFQVENVMFCGRS